MPAVNKPGVYTFVHVIKYACRFITRHQGTFLPVFQSAMSSDDYAKVVAVVNAVVAACAVFDVVYPDIKG